MGRCEDNNRLNGRTSQKIAVIGSGIAGQTAAYFLSKKHNVAALYEASPRPGLHTHSIFLDGFGSVDVPLRAYSPHYYPNLTKLYAHLGVPAQPVNYSSTGVHWSTGQSYFQYYNLLLLRRAIPFLWGKQFSMLSLLCTFRIVRDLLWLVFTGAFLLLKSQRSSLKGKSLGQHVREAGYSFDFVHYFLYPVMSTLLSCSYAQVDAYPAEFILEFYSSRSTTIFTGWNKIPDGVESVSKQLLAPLHPDALRLGVKVKSVTSFVDPAIGRRQVRVEDTNGNVDIFDHVVIATEPNIAEKLWADQTPAEKELLKCMDSFTAEIVVHTDASLMPGSKQEWSGMNYFTFPAATSESAMMPHNSMQERLNASMTSVWVNRYVAGGQRTAVHQLTGSDVLDIPEVAMTPAMGSPSQAVTARASGGGRRSATPNRRKQSATPDRKRAAVIPTTANRGLDLVNDGVAANGGEKEKDLFQTWNPYRAPQEGSLVSKAYMTRAVWTVEGKSIYDHNFAGVQGARNVWLCGSYCSPGVTLLENAVKSALDVAQDFGVQGEALPLKPTTCYEARWWTVLVAVLVYHWRRVVALAVLAAALILPFVFGLAGAEAPAAMLASLSTDVVHHLVLFGASAYDAVRDTPMTLQTGFTQSVAPWLEPSRLFWLRILDDFVALVTATVTLVV